MSSAEPPETNAYKSDGIIVYEALTSGRFEFTTVTIRIESQRDTPATVALSVEPPGNIDAADIGFHEDYHPDKWTIDGGRLQFRGEIASEGDVTTLYGLRTDQPAGSNDVFGQLEIKSVTPLNQAGGTTNTTPQSDEADLIDGNANAEDGTSSVASADESVSSEPRLTPDDPDTSSDSEALQPSSAQTSSEQSRPSSRRSVETDEPAGSEQPDETPQENSQTDAHVVSESLDARDDSTNKIQEPRTEPKTGGNPETGSSVDERDRKSSGGESESDLTASAVSGEDETTSIESAQNGVHPDNVNMSQVSTDVIVEELLSRHKSGQLPEQSAVELRSRLSDDDTNTASVEQRLKSIQQRMADIEAFTDSIKTVHDELGAPDEVLANTRNDLRQLSEQVDEATSELELLSEQTESVASRMDTLERELNETANSVSSLEDEVETLENEQTEMRSRIKTLHDWRETLMESFRGGSSG